MNQSFNKALMETRATFAMRSPTYSMSTIPQGIVQNFCSTPTKIKDFWGADKVIPFPYFLRLFHLESSLSPQ